MKMLIVEDDPVSRLLLHRFLEPYGQVHTAVNGEDAVATFRLAVEQRMPYDLVCLDVMMPGISGHKVLEEIRYIDGNQSRTKVIMTTSRTDISSVDQAIQGRCDAYIIKPVSREALMNELRSLGLVGLKALVVEDDPPSRLLLQRALEQYGQVHAAANGRDAVAMVKLAMAQREPYDLVCLDIMMPEMDGYEALKAIRQIEGERSRAKIVMTTSLSGADDVKKAVQEGCDAYIVKPIRKEMLMDKLRSLKLV